MDFFRKTSLSKDYFKFSAIVMLAVILISAWITFSSYQNVNKERIANYDIEANKAATSLNETFAYVTHFYKYIGDKIADTGKNDPQTIASILEQRVQVGKLNDDILSWILFDFTDPQGYVTAISTIGVAKHPTHIDKYKRAWIETSRLMPWTLQFSEPDIGVSSGEWIIPSGYGVTDRHGKFLGFVSMGFNVDKITHKVQQALTSPETEFVILSQNYNIAATSITTKALRNEFFKKELTGIGFKNDAGLLPHPIQYGNVTFRYYRQAYPYPFTILIGENNRILDREFRQNVEPQLIQTICMGLFFILLLYFFRTQIITPIVRLSNAALALSEGNTDIAIPGINSIEVDNLANALGKVKTLIKNEQDYKNEILLAHKKVKQANESLEQKVIQRTALLQEALLVKNEFLNNVSHELRTPIHGIIAFTEVLHDDWDIFDDAKRREIVDDLYSSTDRLYSLLNNLLDLTKFNEGKMILNKTASNLEDVVKEVVRECKSMLEEASMSLKLVSTTTDITGNFDRDRITQVVRNLYVNAIKYSATGTITISISREKNNLLFSIRDEGKGIPPEELEGIFAPFTQSSRTKTGAGGTGLGLAICQQIILAHKGKIWAENNQTSQGCVFIFMIPAK